jgi:SAM-dependent methyltransferase
MFEGLSIFMPIINKSSLSNPLKRKAIENVIRTEKDSKFSRRFLRFKWDNFHWPINETRLSEVDEAFGERLVDDVSQLNAKSKTGKVLELGCGSARASLKASERFSNVEFNGISLEGHPRWLRENFPQNLNLHNTNYKVFLKYLTKKNKKFNLIFSHFGIKGSAADKLITILKFTTFLKKGGKFYFTPTLHFSEWDSALGKNFEISRIKSKGGRFMVIGRVK